MDSEFRVFQAGFDVTPAGTPLPCPRRMAAQSLAPVAPGRLLLNLLAALLPVPARRVPAVIKRRRA